MVVQAQVSQVAAEVSQGDAVSTSGVGRMLPGRSPGKTVDPSTVFRWISHGIRRSDGARVRLEAIKIGGRFITSKAAVQRFLVASNEAETVNTSEATETKQTRAAKASAKLEAMGA
jgi:hypothetical protein